MSLYSFMDKEKADPKNWAIANAIKKKKQAVVAEKVDFEDIDLLDDDELDAYLTDL